MEKQRANIKKVIEAHYNQLATEKSRNIENWLKKGDKIRPPETSSGNYFIDRKLQTALKLAPLEKGADILEIGCQYGYFTFRLANLGFRVTAVDLSEAALDVVKKRARCYGVTNINFLTADAENMKMLRNESFDAVFSFSCLRYLPSPLKALEEIYRLLKPKGKTIVDFPNRYSPWFKIIKPLIGINPHIHDHLYSSRRLKQILTSAGFNSVKTAKILFTSRKSPAKLLPFFKGLDLVMERLYGLKELASIIMCYGEK